MNYHLVIQFPIANASADYFDRLIGIENELGFILKNRHVVVGHDLGTEIMNITIQMNGTCTTSASTSFEGVSTFNLLPLSVYSIETMAKAMFFLSLGE